MLRFAGKDQGRNKKRESYGGVKMSRFTKIKQKKPNNQQTMRINVNPDDLPDIFCECGCGVFIQGMRIKKVSAIISPDGQEKYIHIPTSVCVQCFRALPDKP